jgi:hypothetical protein
MKISRMSSSQSGSSLLIILVAVSLFAALSYVISQQRDSGKSLSNERVRLLASDVIDMGNKLADAVAQIRLRQNPSTKISFENTVIAGYANAACTTDACKVFAYDGGGKSWETASQEVNSAKDWGFSGDLAIKNIGSDEADLVAILPNMTLDICNRINILIGLYATGGAPTIIVSATANKFTGTFAGVPVSITGTDIDGEKSACIEITTQSGTAFVGTPYTTNYVFYQVLEER